MIQSYHIPIVSPFYSERPTRQQQAEDLAPTAASIRYPFPKLRRGRIAGWRIR